MIENESPFRKAELMQGRGDLLEEICRCSDEIGQIDKQLKQN
jgi:hypothetical protein